MTRLIAFSGPKMSGKDTAAKILFDQNRVKVYGLSSQEEEEQYRYFKKSPFAGTYNPPTGVKGIVSSVFGLTEELCEDPVLKEKKLEEWPFVAPRWPMMDIANWFRDKYGADIWVESLKKRLDDSYWANVITDHRLPEELDWLLSEGALIIYIQRDEMEKKLAAAQASGDQMALNPSEAHYALIKSKATHVIDNNGPMHQVQNEVLQIVRKHYGYWGA